MCTTSTSTVVAPPTSSSSSKVESKGGRVEEVRVGRNPLLDKDWGASIPSYISRCGQHSTINIQGVSKKRVTFR